MGTDWERLLVQTDWTIRQIVQHLDAGARGIVLVVDVERHLVDTVTDGDIRRAILNNLNLDAPLSALLQRKAPGPAGGPIHAPLETAPAALLDLMRRYSVRHIPLLNAAGQVAGLARLEDLVEQPLGLRAVVMAGGYGKRLRPLTENLPKPLLPVGDRPLLQRVIEQLRDAGIREVNVSTHFLAEQVKAVFGDGRQLGVHLDYLAEDQPLGTAGALSLVERPVEPLLVMNGDILTRLDFRAMLHFHQDNGAALTVAVKQYDVQVPYGVVEVEGVNVVRLTEKPLLRFFVIAGIYLLNPVVWDFLPRGEACDMPVLMERLLAAGHTVVSFPVNEYWLDIGRLADYERANQDIASGSF